ncbi:MAG: Fic family protein [Gammaproteobacteria bacterium]|nr:Fic family protein [Gammaproteobacteria bacterium]
MNLPWTPVRDYETPPGELADGELRALSSVWMEQKDTLGESAAVDHFNERLRREWAIETGLIERLYTLDRGITELMIERGVNAAFLPSRASDDPERTAALIGDQQQAIESLFAFVSGGRVLSTSYIRELHSLFTRNQESVEGRDQFGHRANVPLIRGDYKQQPNNPTRPDGTVHVYCPPEHVASEMDRLIAWHREHSDVPPEVEAAWLHHRFVQIHPFQDGNGRLARALATLIFIKADWLPLVVRDDERDRYIGALEAADQGDLRPLVQFFAAVQRRQFINVIGIARDIRQSLRVDARIESIRQQLAARRDALAKEWETAVQNAERLREITTARLTEVRDTLAAAVGDYQEFTLFVDDETDQGGKSHYFHRQIVASAKELDYYANTRQHRAWVRLGIADGRQSNILFSFHGIGHQFQGVLACSASWFQRVASDEGTETSGDSPLCDEVFQVNYKEDIADVEIRYADWLERALERGLAMWERTTL